MASPEHDTAPEQTTVPAPEAEAPAAEPDVAEIAPPDQYECRSCGYIYEPDKGDDRRRVAPDTRFEDLPDNWRCPICGSPQVQFVSIGPKGAPSGFKENLGYGFGVNTLTSGQKSVLIFTSLLLAIAFFLSLYGLR